MPLRDVCALGRCCGRSCRRERTSAGPAAATGGHRSGAGPVGARLAPWLSDDAGLSASLNLPQSELRYSMGYGVQLQLSRVSLLAQFDAGLALLGTTLHAFAVGGARGCAWMPWATSGCWRARASRWAHPAKRPMAATASS